MADGSVGLHALRGNTAETVRGILVVALAYAVFTVGNTAGNWAAAGVSGVTVGRGITGALTVAGCIAFGEVPAWTTLAGAAVVAAAGLYNLHRECVRREAACPIS